MYCIPMIHTLHVTLLHKKKTWCLCTGEPMENLGRGDPKRKEREGGWKLTIPSSLVFSASVICSLVLYSLTILVLTSEKVLMGESMLTNRSTKHVYQPLVDQIILTNHHLKYKTTLRLATNTNQRYYISITIVQSYTGKYHKFVAGCIVTSV